MQEEDEVEALERAIVSFPDEISTDDVLKAAYSLGDVFDVRYERNTSNWFLLKVDGSAVEPSDVADFRRRVYDYHLRSKIRSETASEKLLFLSAAFDRILKSNENA